MSNGIRFLDTTYKISRTGTDLEIFSGNVDPAITFSDNGSNNIVTTDSDLRVAGTSHALRFTSSGGINYIQSGTAFSAGSSADLFIGNVLQSDVQSTRKFMIKADGDVGINTNAPLFPLDVNGEIHSRDKVSVDTSSTMPMELTFGASSEHEIYMGTPGGETGIIFNINNILQRSRFDMFNFESVTVNNRYFGLKYRDATGGLYIKRNDRVGINTTSPSTTLDVNGTFNAGASTMTSFNSGGDNIGGHAVGSTLYNSGNFSATTVLPGAIMYPISGVPQYMMFRLDTSAVSAISISINKYNSSGTPLQTGIATLNIGIGSTYASTSLVGLSTFNAGDYYAFTITSGTFNDGFTCQLYSVFN